MIITAARLRAFADELDSYGGIRNLLELVYEEEPDAIIEIARQYDCDGDFYEIITELTDKIENSDIEEFLELVKENIDETALAEYIDKVLGD